MKRLSTRSLPCVVPLVLTGLVTLGWAASSATTDVVAAQTALAGYRGELDAFRKEFGGAHGIPGVRFYLFGLGPRTKLIYKAGTLIDWSSGKTLFHWDLQADLILPSDYSVFITLTGGKTVRIYEDEEAVWIEEPGMRRVVEGTQHAVRLPSFKEHRYGSVLRVLHHELLVNVINDQPVPNFLVYPKAWYRDGALMAMAFRATGNLGLIRNWILGLRDPYDRNNAGETEADNLGQALFLVSLVSDRHHPLVPRILAELPRFEVTNATGRFLKGRSDFAEHPAYQTKWAKYGLTRLGLPDPYQVPLVQDSYSALFWMAYQDTYVPGKDAADTGAYPYLGWAADHFHGLKRSPISNRDYPLTWEKDASQAQYPGMQTIDPQFAELRLAAPHTWHAAEIFLYLLELKDRPAP